MVPAKHALESGALERLAKAVGQMLPDHPEVIAAYLYGSAARGEPAADLDLALLTRSARVERREIEALAARLQAVGAPHGPPIDLRLLKGTSPRFRANVLRDGHLLYDGDPAARIEFEARALSEWLDFKPTWQRMRRRMFERWTHG